MNNDTMNNDTICDKYYTIYETCPDDYYHNLKGELQTKDAAFRQRTAVSGLTVTEMDLISQTMKRREDIS